MLVVGPIDPLQPRERPGTLEQHLSIKGLLRRAAEVGLETDLLSDIFGDHPVGRQVASEAADLLAVRLSQVVALIDPQMVVLGGVVTRNGGDALIAAIEERMRGYMSSLVERPVPIVASVLGFESVAIGGVALALEACATKPSLKHKTHRRLLARGACMFAPRPSRCYNASQSCAATQVVCLCAAFSASCHIIIYEGTMDAKNVIFGETALDKLVQLLRAGGQPRDIVWLTERYLEILRELVTSEDQRS